MTGGPLPEGWRAVLGTHAPPDAQHPFDAHAWRFDNGRAALLFDSGAGFGPVPPGADALFLSHGHADHARGAARLACPIFAGPQTAAWLGDGDADRISLPRAIAAGIYPPGTRLTPMPGITPVSPGETLRFADITVTAIATPGHSADHMAWLVEADGARVLVAGDAIFEGGTVILQDTWDCSVAETCATIRRIAALAPDAILPGHGAPMVGQAAAAALSAALSRVDRLLAPRLFL